MIWNRYLSPQLASIPNDDEDRENSIPNKDNIESVSNTLWWWPQNREGLEPPPEVVALDEKGEIKHLKVIVKY